MKESSADRPNESTAPKAGETDDLDREEGNFNPGLPEYGPADDSPQEEPGEDEEDAR